MADVAEIAAGLGHLQRSAIRRLSSEWRRAGTSSTFIGFAPGMIEGRFYNRAKQYRLTPLGLAVRNHLLNQEPHNAS